MRRIASAMSGAIERVRSLAQARASGPSGIVSVTTTAASGEASMRATAPGDSTGWVTHATTDAAPAWISAWAAVVKVSAVSTMSSTMIAAALTAALVPRDVAPRPAKTRWRETTRWIGHA